MADYPFFRPGDEGKVAYIRLMDRALLPDEIRERLQGMDKVYSIHDADGQVLALTDDRRKAFVMARMNEMRPYSVH